MGHKLARGALIIFLALAAGFVFGRYGLGEGYLKQSIGQIERPQVAPQQTGQEPSTAASEDVPLIIPEIPPPPPPEEREIEPAEEGGEPLTPAWRIVPEENPEDDDSEADPTPRRTESGPRYGLQAGHFESVTGARQVALHLSNMGYDAEVKPQKDGGVTTFRVVVGPYNDEATARAKAAELEERGFEVFLLIE